MNSLKNIVFHWIHWKTLFIIEFIETHCFSLDALKNILITTTTIIINMLLNLMNNEQEPAQAVFVGVDGEEDLVELLDWGEKKKTLNLKP